MPVNQARVKAAAPCPRQLTLGEWAAVARGLALMHPPRGGWGTTRLCTLRTWGETPTQTRQANEPEALGGVSSLQGLTLNGTPFLQGDPPGTPGESES